MLKFKNKALGPLLRRGTAVLITAAMLLPAVGCFAPPPNTPSVTDQTPPAASGDAVIRTRSQMLHFSDPLDRPDPQPKVPAYHVEPDLSNVENAEQIYLTEKTRKLLADNMFAVVRRGMNEFFEGYENNRYATIPNFVTVDSLMHTYHLYFSMLLNRTEKTHNFFFVKKKLSVSCRRFIENVSVVIGAYVHLLDNHFAVINAAPGIF